MTAFGLLFWGLLPTFVPPAAGLLAQFDFGSAPHAASTQSFRQGTQGFRQILHKLSFDQPLQMLDELMEEPEHKLLVILGDLSVLRQGEPGVQRSFDLGVFLARGGAALVATDRPWDSQLGVMVDGRRVSYGRSVHPDELPENFYYGRPACPRIQRMPDSPLFHPKYQHATANLPSFLTLRTSTPPFVPMAQFPSGCVLEDGLEYQAPTRAFAAGASWPVGRLLVVADHSMFINDMLLREDTYNITFAIHCLGWVRGQQERRQVLFLEEGMAVTNFQESLGMPPPPPEALAELMNTAIRGLQEEDRFNELALRMLSRWIRPDQILLAAMLLLTFILVGYGFLRLGKNRHRVEKGRMLLATLLARPVARAAAVELRHRAMLEEGNLWEAARALTRQCFDGTLRANVAAMSQLAAEWGQPPRVQVAGGWWKRWQLGNQVRRLWQLAYDPVPAPVSAREFTQLAAQVRTIRAALEAGTIRIEPP